MTRPTEEPGQVRRMRVQFHGWHHPPVWASYYEPPGRSACYVHADSLPQMMNLLALYFAGKGLIQPLRVEARHV